MAISLIIARRTGERALEFSHALECRASTSSLRRLEKKDVDGRDKPGHDAR